MPLINAAGTTEANNGEWWSFTTPVAGDFNGDGKTDKTIFREMTGDWWILFSSDGWMREHWGAAGKGDVPVNE